MKISVKNQSVENIYIQSSKRGEKLKSPFDAERSCMGIERRKIKCQEETEQGQEVRDLEQVEAVVAVDKEEEVEGVVAEAKEEVLQQARKAIAFARAVAKEQPMNWVLHVMSKNAPNAAML